eukprot:Protomagalhaensia_sp_Gyna_25__1888@NODE_1_length_10645_cov_612_087781_g0_i0_p3_GENE_NODE_1_length_10645_cov_612_087781_g0_i0NODE_1_length_10645_cov_612_087781_g0_i0_p3_ORF_typecomplete_len476_score117_18Thioredoxin/PF00085_20/4_1e34Thioredoxin/PF00085_20/15Thioredoxin/PF00085_20/5e26Thioredoxin_6/PF13848_6/0_046Thioredoxin_6/PF13848_6/7_8e10Thioredoxin_6/PF13848_6/2_7e20Thioredoxin_6/PF13848_6/19Thioredoxin_6/PF13848_6/0_0076Calsequestrin/PF01216_17/8_1e20Calsequestrin/PF01216_17/2_6e02Thioredox
MFGWTKFAACLAGLAVANEAASSSSEAVVTLTSSSFDSFIKENSNALVKFYAPWCGHCKKLAPEYEAAAEVLKAENIPLAKVDATEEKELAEKFEIRGFPTMYFFRNGEPEEYDGGRTKETIVQWVKSMTGPAVRVQESAEAAQKAVVEGVGYLLTVPSQEHKAYAAFKAVADKNRAKGAFFAVIDSKASSSSIKAITKDDVYNAPTELTTEEAILKFVKAESTPVFGPITPETYRAYAAKSENWFWFAGTPENFEEAKKEISAVARIHRDDLNFVWLNTSNEQFKKHAEGMFGMTSFPSAALVMGRDKYKYEGPFTQKKTGAYVQDVLDGKVEKFLLSEDIPESNDDPVKVVVGKTFKSLVLQSNKDVFLKVYAPWCGHCKKLAPIWEEFADRTKDSKNFIVAKMDGTANEAPVDGFDIRGFPTLFFVKANTSEPLTYSGDRTLEAFVKFAKEHSTHPIVLADSGDKDDSKDEL